VAKRNDQLQRHVHKEEGKSVAWDWWHHESVPVLRESMVDAMEHEMGSPYPPIEWYILHPIFFTMEKETM
jgi:hypothetical protein